jgi:hypothetical protein
MANQVLRRKTGQPSDLPLGRSNLDRLRRRSRLFLGPGGAASKHEGRSEDYSAHGWTMPPRLRRGKVADD